MVQIGENMREKKEKKINVKSMVEDIVGCKWSLSVLDMIDKGINRPGAMTREINGLTTKVLNERLKKLLKYKIIKKIEYNEIPPRVEYLYTDFGLKFVKIVNEIRLLEKEVLDS
ncbi:MAG: winged helix-turn-helix transcriptional regulator [Oligoflexia bacterium]|nr:winged helix-turn-helix transcriptional regulator [Oligoflexia bacterium]